MRPRTTVSLLSILSVVLAFFWGPQAIQGKAPAKPAAHAPVKKPATVTPAAPPLGKVLPKGSPVFLWRAAGEGKGTVYLLGTFHLVKPDFYPLPSEMEKAFNKSERLVLEIDPLKVDTQALSRIVKDRGTYAFGEYLKDHVSSETNSALNAYLSSSGQSTAQFMNMKPWLVALTIGMAEIQRQGFNPNLGIDRYFANKANKSNKAIIGLETEEGQIRMFSDFDDKLQDQYLLHSLHEIKNIEKDLAEIVDAWNKGDDKAMNEALTRDTKEYPELKPLEDKMITERNIAMAEKIDGFLKGGGNYFVAVGSGHLVGEKGLVALLKEKGYKVEQVTAGANL